MALKVMQTKTESAVGVVMKNIKGHSTASTPTEEGPYFFWESLPLSRKKKSLPADLLLVFLPDLIFLLWFRSSFFFFSVKFSLFFTKPVKKNKD